MKEGFDLIEIATELFALKVNDDSLSGLLYPIGSIFSYGRPALFVYANLHGDGTGPAFFACIRSIDDSGVSIFGPIEDVEKSRKRLKNFAQFLIELEYACPTKEQLREFCKNNYLQESYWE